MWTLKVLRKNEEIPLTYIGPDRSIQTLFELYKREFPDALYLLESITTGQTYFPHYGNGYPFWYLADGMENMQFYTQMASTKEQYRRDFELQKRYEPETDGHSSVPENPPDDYSQIL